jgi:hypothetical protein
MILSLEELKKDRNLINSIDWEMTPEMAVRVYLEWGNIWAHGENRKYVVRSNTISAGKLTNNKGLTRPIQLLRFYPDYIHHPEEHVVPVDRHHKEMTFFPFRQRRIKGIFFLLPEGFQYVFR